MQGIRPGPMRYSRRALCALPHVPDALRALAAHVRTATRAAVDVDVPASPSFTLLFCASFYVSGTIIKIMHCAIWSSTHHADVFGLLVWLGTVWHSWAR